MFKKTIALLFCFIISITALNAEAIALDNSMLTDIDAHWGEDDIVTLNRLGILNGSNNKANPDSLITRGEFTALISRGLNLKGDSTKVFGDVSKNHIFFDVISAASSNGIINGMSDGNFYPEKNITREEIMLIISRCIKSDNNKTPRFSDINKNYQYMSNLTAAVSSGIISGYSDGTFRPKKNATRAESATMTVRLLKAQNGVSKNEIKAFSEKYIENDMQNITLNIDNSIGKALEEIKYRQSAIDEILKNGADVKKEIRSINLKEILSEGILSKVRYTGDINYTRKYSDGTTDTNSYIFEITLDIISRNDNLYVYNYNLNLRKNEKINLTWEVYSTPPYYAPDGVNVISPSSFQLSNENLNVESTYIADGINFFNALTKKYMEYANKNNYDVWAMYKTDFTLKTSNDFLNNASSRKKALDLLIKYACKYKIHGINFDFENIYVSNKELLTKHIREVALVMHEMGLIVSVDITRKEVTSSVWSMCYDRDALSETADYVMLMAYDEYYAGSPVPGSVASLDWTEDTIKLTLNEVSKEKLILGIPFYMRYWEVTNGKVTVSRAISMQTAYELITQNDVTYTWLENDGQYKISWSKGNKTCMFWLENSDTIKERVLLSKKYSLAGIASWRRGLEIKTAWNIIKENL